MSRTVIGLSKSIYYDEILKFAKTSSVDKRRKYRLYKALNNLGPSYTRDFLGLKAVGYNLWGKGIKLTLRCFHLEWVHQFFSYNLLSAKSKGGPRDRRFQKSLAKLCFNILSCMMYDLLLL